MMKRVTLVLAVSIALAPAAHAADQAAGVMLGVSGNVTVERQAGGSAQATLGMKLEPADVVAVDKGGSAEVYLRGGGVVHLHDATRFTMPKAQDTPPSTTSRLGSGSIAQLESGLWVLNDPKGSLLVSPMRGDGGFDAAPVPLTPRYEALTGTAATFMWSGGPGNARVVVAKNREVIWKSAPASPGTILTPGSELPLAAGEVYTWWLEPEAGGVPLTAGMPFRIAAQDVLDRTKAVETELRRMTEAGTDKAAVDYLRIAHYTGASSWSRVLTLTSKMPKGDARNRAFEAATAGLRLDAPTAEALAGKLGAGSTR
jgi:hypothetical protein